LATSTNLLLPYLEASQAQKHVTHNDALRILDGVVQLSVIDKDLTAPPGGPADGDRYIVASGATGAWSGKDLNIAIWQDGAWRFYPPRDGWVAWVSDENLIYIYNTNAWVQHGLVTANGAMMQFKSLSEEVTLSGATTDSTIFFPNPSLSMGATVRVTQAITASGGGTTFSVGDAGSPGRYGSGLGFSLGVTNPGIIGPTGYYGSDDEIRFTPNAGSFTGGKVRVTIFFMQITPPTS
jgi:hypothetical protein